MSPDTSSCVLGAPLGETLGGHNASALESHNTSELHVCLGPGPLCPGGAFVEGTGRNPVCVYPPNLSGYAVLLTIISIMMAFERLKHWLMRSVPRSYTPVMHAMFGELSSLGFVSLVVFLLEVEPEGYPSLLDRLGRSVGLGHDVHNTFVRIHYLLFGVSVRSKFLLGKVCSDFYAGRTLGH